MTKPVARHHSKQHLAVSGSSLQQSTKYCRKGTLSNDDHDEAVNDNERHDFPFKRLFPIIPTRSVCKMCSNVQRIKLARQRKKCRQVPSSSTEPKFSSFHVVVLARTTKKCTCSACTTIVFSHQICRFVTFSFSSLFSLFKVPETTQTKLSN